MSRRVGIIRSFFGLLVAAAVALGLVIVGPPPTVTEGVCLPALADMPASAWDRLAGRRIFFGHKSVGDNLVAGLEDLVRQQPQLRLRVVRTSDPADFAAPVFGHAHLGTNGDPRSKLAAFADLMSGPLGACVDVAFFKFCYVDVTADTDVPALFADYRATLDRLRLARPRVTFVHVTVPLTVRPTGPKAAVWRLLGRPDNNVARCRFNELLRKEYAGRAPLFDLARCEATAPDGFVRGHEVAGLRVEGLWAAYSDDGGHLNAAGRRWAAEALLVVLGRAAAVGPPTPPGQDPARPTAPPPASAPACLASSQGLVSS